VFPWLLLWAPHYHLFNQNVQPQTDWTFGNISPLAGDAATEKRIHEGVASYGRQIGLVTEVLLSLADKDAVSPAQATESLDRLKEIREDIERLKAAGPTLQQAAAVLLQRLAQEDPAACAQLAQRFVATPPRLPGRSPAS
jgi:hypothetical protein